jgi:hypothetical protein
MQHVLVQAQVRHQLAQPRVLIAQLFRFLRLAHIHAAVLRVPGIDRMLFDTPTSRATSSALRPASNCFNAPIISASVCLLIDIVCSPSFRPKSYSGLFGTRGAGQNHANDSLVASAESRLGDAGLSDAGVPDLSVKPSTRCALVACEFHIVRTTRNSALPLSIRA